MVAFYTLMCFYSNTKVFVPNWQTLTQVTSDKACSIKVCSYVYLHKGGREEYFISSIFCPHNGIGNR